MQFFDLLKLSTRMFKARTSRTLLTILGMGVGIGAIVFLVSLGYGLQKTLLQKITTSDSLLTLDVAAAESDQSLSNETAEQIRAIDGVDDVSPRFNIPSRAKIDDLNADITVAGVEPLFLRLAGTSLSRGRALNDEEKEGIVITTSAAQAFGKNEDNIMGQKLEFTFSVPRENASGEEVSEEIKSTASYSVIGVVEEEDSLIYVNAHTLDYLAITKFDQFKVRCASNERMKVIREELLSSGLSVSSLSDAVDQANKVFKVIQVVLGCFGAVALVVSAIGMFNTMTIALLERTREIGIMKSIGASDKVISSMFIMESTIMGFLGGVGGVAMGFLTGRFFNTLVNLVATRLGGQSIELFFTPAWFAIIVIMFGTIVGCATGMVPARRASRIDTLDSLHNK